MGRPSPMPSRTPNPTPSQLLVRYRNQSIVLFSTKSAKLRKKDLNPDQTPDLNPDPNLLLDPTKKGNLDLDRDQKQPRNDRSVILCMHHPSPSVPKRVLPQQSDRSTKHVGRGQK